MYPHWLTLQMFVTNRRFPIFAAVHVQAPAELTFAEPTVTVPSKHCFMFADTPVAFIAVVQESAAALVPPGKFCCCPKATLGNSNSSNVRIFFMSHTSLQLDMFYLPRCAPIAIGNRTISKDRIRE